MKKGIPLETDEAPTFRKVAPQYRSIRVRWKNCPDGPQALRVVGTPGPIEYAPHYRVRWIVSEARRANNDTTYVYVALWGMDGSSYLSMVQFDTWGLTELRRDLIPGLANGILRDAKQTRHDNKILLHLEYEMGWLVEIDSTDPSMPVVVTNTTTDIVAPG